MKTITVEIVARVQVPDDTPMIRLLVDHNLPIPLIVAPIAPEERAQRFDADVLTIQYRITEGNFYLHPEPHERLGT